MSKPSGTNCPKLSGAGSFSHTAILLKPSFTSMLKILGVSQYGKRQADTKDLGGYSDGVPPLPIPNREVKPVSADGTAYKVGE